LVGRKDQQHFFCNNLKDFDAAERAGSAHGAGRGAWPARRMQELVKWWNLLEDPLITKLQKIFDTWGIKAKIVFVPVAL
jgi:hypothetical protein